VLQRVGSNALTVIDNAKAALADVQKALPEGTQIVPVYDRSTLINSAIETLKGTLFEESLVVAAVTIIFLLHVRSALVAIIMLPVGILMAFSAMKFLGLGSNIMSLGGIAIAIGAMIDAAIVMIENAHKHLERAEPGKPRVEILIEAAAEVGPALFFSLLIITVSFLPIFTLENQEGKLFGPLAFTKTFSMAAAGCCQTNANSSQFTSKANLLGHEETAPLSESSGTVQLEIGAGREAAFLIEMVEDRGMNRHELL
jgi:Cu(I)/Ag(I) efflux system membrane protein CusA/SilA